MLGYRTRTDSVYSYSHLFPHMYNIYSGSSIALDCCYYRTAPLVNVYMAFFIQSLREYNKPSQRIEKDCAEQQDGKGEVASV